MLYRIGLITLVSCVIARALPDLKVEESVVLDVPYPVVSEPVSHSSGYLLFNAYHATGARRNTLFAMDSFGRVLLRQRIGFRYEPPILLGRGYFYSCGSFFDSTPSLQHAIRMPPIGFEASSRPQLLSNGDMMLPVSQVWGKDLTLLYTNSIGKILNKVSFKGDSFHTPKVMEKWDRIFVPQSLHQGFVFYVTDLKGQELNRLNLSDQSCAIEATNDSYALVGCPPNPSGPSNVYVVDKDGKINGSFKTKGSISSAIAYLNDSFILTDSWNGGYVYRINTSGKLLAEIHVGGLINDPPQLFEDGTIAVVAKNWAAPSFFVTLTPELKQKGKHELEGAISLVPTLTHKTIPIPPADYFTIVTTQLWKAGGKKLETRLLMLDMEAKLLFRSQAYTNRLIGGVAKAEANVFIATLSDDLDEKTKPAQTGQLIRYRLNR